MNVRIHIRLCGLAVVCTGQDRMCFFWNCDDDKAKPYVIGLLRPLIYNSKVIAEQLQIKRHGYCSSNWVVMKHLLLL